MYMLCFFPKKAHLFIRLNNGKNIPFVTWYCWILSLLQKIKKKKKHTISDNAKLPYFEEKKYSNILLNIIILTKNKPILFLIIQMISLDNSILKSVSLIYVVLTNLTYFSSIILLIMYYFIVYFSLIVLSYLLLGN